MKKDCACNCECKSENLMHTCEEKENLQHFEETETGVEYGCNPSPWAPCVFPPNYTYKKEYSIKRTWSK